MPVDLGQGKMSVSPHLDCVLDCSWQPPVHVRSLPTSLSSVPENTTQQCYGKACERKRISELEIGRIPPWPSPHCWNHAGHCWAPSAHSWGGALMAFSCSLECISWYCVSSPTLRELWGQYQPELCFLWPEYRKSSAIGFYLPSSGSQPRAMVTADIVLGVWPTTWGEISYTWHWSFGQALFPV